MPPKRICVLPLNQLRAAGEVRVEALERPIVQRQHAVLRRLDQEEPLQLGKLLRVLLRQILRLGPIGVGVVQLPEVFVEPALVGAEPGYAVPRHRRPSLVIDAAIAEHLEVLRLVPFRRPGVVERIEHADAFERRLLHAVDHGRMRQAGGLEDGRRDVDDMMELAADLALRLDAFRPVHDRAVARAAPVRRDLLGPLVGRVHRVRPADGIVVVGVRPAEDIDLRRQELGGLERAQAVEDGHLVEAAVRRAFGRRAVVADDQVDQRVVEDLQILERVDRAGRDGGRCVRGTPHRPPSRARRSAACSPASCPTQGSRPAARSARRRRGSRQASSVVRTSPRAACPSPDRTCLCISRSSPSAHGAARGRRRARNT